MPGLRAWIAYGWRERSTLFPYPFHPESELWNRKVLPSPSDVVPSQVLPKSQRCPRTSSHDLLSQLQILISCPLFGPHAVINVSSGGVPANYLTVLVSERL